MIAQRDIVLLAFPFSDLKRSKVRPALVVSNDLYNKKFEDFIAVPLTTNLKSRDHSILITDKNLERGRLIVDSNIKTDKIFSVSKKLVRANIGKVNKETHDKVTRMLVDIIK